MLITSLSFFICLAAFIGLYYLLPLDKANPNRWRNLALLLASYAFCISWAWHFALVLFATTLFNYLWAQQIASADGARRTRRLWLGIVINLLALGGFKLADFFANNIPWLLRQMQWAPPGFMLSILLPLGMSFYILQAIAYLVDVSRARIPASHNPVDFALYLAYFPKLLAGPIERAGAFLPQLANERRFSFDLWQHSLGLILLGLVRKLFLADGLYLVLPRLIFEQPDAYAVPLRLFWWAVFSLALYNDFAGYTNLARGISGLFGLELSQNFHFPFAAANLADFWNRWHISLSHWLRDYIFFPLTRALLQRNPQRNHWSNLLLPPIIAMFISGLWHGFSPGILIWGLFSGVALALERWLVPLIKGDWGDHALFTRIAEAIPPLSKAARGIPSLIRGAGGILQRGVIFGLTAFPLFLIQIRWQGVLHLPDGWLEWQHSSAFINPVGLVFCLALCTAALALETAQYRQQDELFFWRGSFTRRTVWTALALIFIFIGSFLQPGSAFVYQGF